MQSSSKLVSVPAHSGSLEGEVAARKGFLSAVAFTAQQLFMLVITLAAIEVLIRAGTTYVPYGPCKNAKPLLQGPSG